MFSSFMIYRNSYSDNNYYDVIVIIEDLRVSVRVNEVSVSK